MVQAFDIKPTIKSKEVTKISERVVLRICFQKVARFFCCWVLRSGTIFEKMNFHEKITLQFLVYSFKGLFKTIERHQTPYKKSYIQSSFLTWQCEKQRKCKRNGLKKTLRKVRSCPEMSVHSHLLHTLLSRQFRSAANFWNVALNFANVRCCKGLS